MGDDDCVMSLWRCSVVPNCSLLLFSIDPLYVVQFFVTKTERVDMFIDGFKFLDVNLQCTLVHCSFVDDDITCESLFLRAKLLLHPSSENTWSLYPGSQKL